MTRLGEAERLKREMGHVMSVFGMVMYFNGALEAGKSGR